MARRRESLAEALFVLPWWISVVVAAAAYALLAFAAPRYFESNQYSVGFGIAAENLGLIFAGIFLLIGFLSFLRGLFVKRKFNALASVEHVRQLSWRQFEAIVGEAFRRRGY